MTITIERQAPERGDHGVATAPAGGCCCCCCCCLHSAGGLIGAATARPEPLPVQLPVSTIHGAPLEPKYTAHGLYWSLVAMLCLVFAAVVSSGVVTRDRVDMMLLSVTIALVFPALQLVASVLAVLVIWRSRREGKSHRMRHLGSITWRAFFGGLIGVLAMLPLLGRC